jgi:hypothetical protein
MERVTKKPRKSYFERKCEEELLFQKPAKNLWYPTAERVPIPKHYYYKYRYAIRVIDDETKGG